MVEGVTELEYFCNECSDRNNTKENLNQKKISLKLKAVRRARDIIKEYDNNSTQVEYAQAFIAQCSKDNCPNAQYCLTKLDDII